MSNLGAYDVEFRHVKLAPAPAPGDLGVKSAYAYTRTPRRAIISAPTTFDAKGNVLTSATPGQIANVLQNNFPPLPGEAIEVLSVRQHLAPGSEGAGILA